MKKLSYYGQQNPEIEPHISFRSLFLPDEANFTSSSLQHNMHNNQGSGRALLECKSIHKPFNSSSQDFGSSDIFIDFQTKEVQLSGI